jgi:hypothetical protein
MFRGTHTPVSPQEKNHWIKLWIIKMIKYNTVVCCYGKILVNVATYVIDGLVCVWGGGGGSTFIFAYF